MLSSYHGYFSHRRYQCAITSPRAVLQCPQCQKYWSKATHEWACCEWLSPKLAQLCLAQVHPCPLSPGHHHNHPHLKAATQLPTKAHSNLLRVEVVMERRQCCVQQRWSESWECYQSTGSPRPTVGSLDGQDITLGYCFNLRYYLCDSCSDEVDSREAFLASTVKADKGGRQRVTTLAKVAARKARALATCLVPLARVITSSSGSRSSSSSKSPKAERRVGLSLLSGDCVRCVLGYVPVTSPSCLARASHAWHCVVKTAELHQFARLVEAWNEAACTCGTYVDLGNYYFPGWGTCSQTCEGEVVLGGYLRLLPCTEMMPDHTDLNDGKTLVQASLPKALPAAMQWTYTKPERQLRPSTTLSLTSSPHQAATTVFRTLLGALPRRHQALLQRLHQCHHNHNHNSSSSSRELEMQELTRETLLLPYLVTAKNATAETKSSGERPHVYAFNVLFSLSY